MAQASHQADPGSSVSKTFSEEINGGGKRKVDSGLKMLIEPKDTTFKIK